MIKVDVYGVRETLAELRKYEPETFKAIKKDLLLSAQPAAAAVGSEFPDKPLRNWHTSGGRRGKAEMPPYSGVSAKSKVKVVLVSKRPTGQQKYGLIRLQQMDAGGAVFDFAGSATKGNSGKGSTSSERFISNLDKSSNSVQRTSGNRSRVMFTATRKHLPLIEQAIEASISKIDSEVQKRLNGY
jgi:hypothetical protein